MNQQAIKDINVLIDLVNEILSILEEFYLQTEYEEVRKEAVNQTVNAKVSLAELQRVEKLLHHHEMNDIEAAKNKKIIKEQYRNLTKRKMDLEVGIRLQKL